MRTAILCVALAACGDKTDSKKTDTPGSASSAKPVDSGRFGKVKQPKVSPSCQKARELYGYGAECVETELPDLTSPAGKVTRVAKKGDPAGRWAYILTRPDGTLFMESDSRRFGNELTKGFDLPTAAPELLAKLFAGFRAEASIVRCLPGANDTLPNGDNGKPLACTPPTITRKGDKVVLSFILEQFPHLSLPARDAHELWAEKTTLLDHEFVGDQGERIAKLPDAPAPKDAPPVPTMSTPPAWVAKPVDAPADVSAALCAEASKKVGGVEGRQCKAYAYPSLDTPLGSLFYLANDAGQRNLLAMKKTDGTIVVGYDLETTENPMIAIVKNYDPAVIPADKLVALHLFLDGEPAHILCLPGSNDVIPDSRCEAPKAEKKGDEVVLTYIIEELPFPDKHGSVAEPAVRSFSTELTPGGGSLGGGSRLVDMRDTAD